MRPPRPLRSRPLWLAVLAVTLVLTGGCSDRDTSAETPAATNPAPTTPAPRAPGLEASPVPSTVRPGGDGLDVRYLDRDGTIKTLRVEDFPR